MSAAAKVENLSLRCGPEQRCPLPLPTARQVVPVVEVRQPRRSERGAGDRPELGPTARLA